MDYRHSRKPEGFWREAQKEQPSSALLPCPYSKVNYIKQTYFDLGSAEQCTSKTRPQHFAAGPLLQ